MKTSMPAPAAVTPMAFVAAICKAYIRQGKDPLAALQLAQIAPELVQMPQARITALQMERISGTAMQELDDEGLGCFSRRLPWGSYGMLARASLTAPDLGLALKRWCRHHHLLADNITLALQHDGDEARLSLSIHNDGCTDPEFCLVSVLRNIHGLACWLIDSRIPLREAAFPYAAPGHQNVYPLLFPGPIRFDADGAWLRFDARYLTLPVQRDERAMRQMLQHALPLTVLQYRRDRLLVQRVRQALAAHPEATHNAEGLAHLLHLSTRTLHRQLREEGASLQQLKDEVRCERARNLLLRTRQPIKQVAAAVGFKNEKSFIRAFKGWTGMGPGEVRQIS